MSTVWIIRLFKVPDVGWRALKPGVLVYRAKTSSGVVAVGPGFLQVAPPSQADTAHDRVLVLVDHVAQP